MESSEGIEDLKPGPGYLATVLRPLALARSTDDFDTWIQNETEEDIEDLTPGYVFFFETGIRAFGIAAGISPVLDLNYPYVLVRAEGELVDPDKIPESNERLDFFRNLKQIQKDIRPVNTWENTDRLVNAIGPLSDIAQELRDSVQPNPDSGLSKGQPLDFGTRIQLVDRFMNMQKAAPRGYGPTNLDKWLFTGPREEALKGYARTLQFVWFQILGPEKYEDSAISEIHRAKVWENRQWGDDNKLSLQQFTTEVRNQLLTPIDERLRPISGGRLVEPDDLLQTDGSIGRHVFDPLLSKAEAPDRGDLTIEEELDYILFWNNAEWLGATTFGKAASFETTLWGLAMLFMQDDPDVPIHVARFRHPRPDGEGNRFSYGILQRLPHAGIGDPSGWLIFHEVGTDFSGSESAVIRVENCIEEVGKLWPIERRELTIGLEQFRQLMAVRLADDYLQNEAEAQATTAQLDAARGLLLELAGYLALSNQEEILEVFWSEDLGNGEIDLLAIGENQYRVVECKSNPSAIRLDDEVSKLETKASSITGKNPVSLEFMFWVQPSKEVSEAIRKADVEYSVLSELPALEIKDLDRFDDVFTESLREARFEGPMGPVRRYPGIQKNLFWYHTLADHF